LHALQRDRRTHRARREVPGAAATPNHQVSMVSPGAPAQSCGYRTSALSRPLRRVTATARLARAGSPECSGGHRPDGPMQVAGRRADPGKAPSTAGALPRIVIRTPSAVNCCRKNRAWKWPVQVVRVLAGTTGAPRAGADVRERHGRALIRRYGWSTDDPRRAAAFAGGTRYATCSSGRGPAAPEFRARPATEPAGMTSSPCRRRVAGMAGPP